jgi:hypothetical protein
MRVVCAWCDTVLDEIEPLDNPSATHGICPECEEKVLADSGYILVGDELLLLADEDKVSQATQYQYRRT